MNTVKIIDNKFDWQGTLKKRSTTEYIILHHSAANGDVMSVHNGHLANGWSGIGYHFYIRKDGRVYRGRPIATVGAHCVGYNDKSVGVCFEGNYETGAEMTDIQKRAGRETVSYLKNVYHKAQVMRHCDFANTACPGKKFPFEEIKKGVTEMTVEEAIEIIQAKAGLEDETIEFLLCYKYGEELILKIAESMV